MTGIYNYYPLRLSGLPRPVVPEGGNVTLHCTSHSNYDKFILTKEDQKFTSSLDAEYISSTSQYQATFVIGP
ncbi:hypothetical protein OFM21_28600, partial [Escherichia coli]|nr:hypothetical protein [Escherichia coli]